MVIFRPLLWPWIWLCGSRDLETTLHEKFSSTCLLHNINKLEVYYLSLACNIKSNFTYLRLKRMLIVHRSIVHVCTQLFTFISTWYPPSAKVCFPGGPCTTCITIQGSTLTFKFKSTCPIGQVLEKVTCPHFLPVARFTAQQQTVRMWEEVRHVT